jgi:hypothetical protein
MPTSSSEATNAATARPSICSWGPLPLWTRTTWESLEFVAGCEKVETQLDGLGRLAEERLGTVRQFAQNQGFTTNEVNQSIFEARQILREISK